MSYQIVHVNSHLRGHIIWPSPNHFTTGKSFKIYHTFASTLIFQPKWLPWKWSHCVLLKKPIHNTTPTSHTMLAFWNWEIQALGRRKQRITPVEITSSHCIQPSQLVKELGRFVIGIRKQRLILKIPIKLGRKNLRNNIWDDHLEFQVPKMQNGGILVTLIWGYFVGVRFSVTYRTLSIQLIISQLGFLHFRYLKYLKCLGRNRRIYTPKTSTDGATTKSLSSHQHLLVVEPTPLKYMLVKMGIFSNVRGEN